VNDYLWAFTYALLWVLLVLLVLVRSTLEARGVHRRTCLFCGRVAESERCGRCEASRVEASR